MRLPRITKENFLSRLEARECPWLNGYLAMYSSQWQGVTTDPDLMMIPIDDHVVHRGDGVFDVMRCVRGRIYQMEAHLQRLERSAGSIFLGFPPEHSNIRDLIQALVRMGGKRDCLIRVTLSRGPGSFSPNPYDCPSPQIYITVIRMREIPERDYQKGIALVTSRVPIKKSYFANIKSCNYLPNVLMKKEAIDAGCQYSVALDEEGCLAEGSTENIGVVTDDGVLKFPGFERTLSGITVQRLFTLAEALVEEGVIKGVRFAKILPEAAYQSKEMFLTGTSLNLLPVVLYDGRRIGDGSPGPVYRRLSSLLWEDMTRNEALLTQIDWDSTD
jgi:branched-subunit amino acid aminotransferase/4-amino-4-deoxychorismate lyase